MAACRLLVQAVQSSTGRRARHVEHLVSEAFVVATQRVKQALKSEIPHMEHHVSKLEFVGVQTQLKLQDIRAAAAAAGVVGLSVVHNCVTTGASPRAAVQGVADTAATLPCSRGGGMHEQGTAARRNRLVHCRVDCPELMRWKACMHAESPELGRLHAGAPACRGQSHTCTRQCRMCQGMPHNADTRSVPGAVGQFRDLVESCARDVQLQETLRKVLAFTARGWDAARQHAMRAVQTDNRMRIWCADDAMTVGLLFRCALGRVDIHNPVGAGPCLLPAHRLAGAWPGCALAGQAGEAEGTSTSTCGSRCEHCLTELGPALLSLGASAGRLLVPVCCLSLLCDRFCRSICSATAAAVIKRYYKILCACSTMRNNHLLLLLHEHGAEPASRPKLAGAGMITAMAAWCQPPQTHQHCGICRAAETQAAGWGPHPDGGGVHHAAGGPRAAAGAAAAGPGPGRLVAARPPRLGHLAC